MLATYLGVAACATPKYVADKHAALQAPVTLGEGHTGKPALDELPAEPAPAPTVHSAPCAPVVHPAPPSTPPGVTEPSALQGPAASAPAATQPTAGASAPAATQPTAGTSAPSTQPTAGASAPAATQPTAGTSAAAANPPCAASTAGSPVNPAHTAAAGTPAAAGAPAAPSVAALLEGDAAAETEGGSKDAAAPAAAPFDPRATPDPKDQATDAYYELTLRYCNAGVHLSASRRVKLGKPSTLPRKMGRFAAELWIGHELLERARFDFPMTAADPVLPAGTARPEPPPVQLAPGTDVVWKVKVADRVRATQAWVIDRATGERWLLDWPPTASKAKPTADAACPSFGGK